MMCFELLMLYLLLIPVAAQRAYELYDEGILSHLSNLNPSWDFLEPTHPPNKKKKKSSFIKNGSLEFLSKLICCLD